MLKAVAPLAVEIQTLVESARRDGVTLDANLPFISDASTPKRDAGVLLVHGLTATPREMYFLAEELGKAGFFCLGIRLPGHGTQVDDLRQRTRQEWLAAVDEGYRLLQSKVARIYGIGMSTGGLLLLQLAATRSFEGAVALSPFLRLAHWLGPAAGLISRWQADYPAPQTAETAPYYYDKRPLRAVAELNHLCAEVGRLAPGLNVPLLAINALGDRTVSIDSGRRLFQRLNCHPKEYHLFDERAGHVLSTPDNPCFGETMRLIRNFLDDRERANDGRVPSA